VREGIPFAHGHEIQLENPPHEDAARNRIQQPKVKVDYRQLHANEFGQHHQSWQAGAYGGLHECKSGTNSHAHRGECCSEGDFGAPNGELALVPFRTSPVSISEPSPVCYSSPRLRRAHVLQQTKAAIYEFDHTGIDNAVEDIVPIAPRLNYPAIGKALELVANGLRLHTKLRCQAAWINLTLLQQHMQKTKARIIR
jgi:hypothetical protein